MKKLVANAIIENVEAAIVIHVQRLVDKTNQLGLFDHCKIDKTKRFTQMSFAENKRLLIKICLYKD